MNIQHPTPQYSIHFKYATTRPCPTIVNSFALRKDISLWSSIVLYYTTLCLTGLSYRVREWQRVVPGEEAGGPLVDVELGLGGGVHQPTQLVQQMLLQPG